ncbi:hypothetical protein [Marinobacter sp. V034]|uniref:hypothetical protein n=1 Tax=Marinobacter sp. V034 TaxID=3459610 RepID=UPI0040445DED
MAQATEGILNITNGDCAVEIMSSASLPGRYLPWRDILHEGPVPAGLTLEALSDVRAAAIAGRGWGDGEAIRTSFAERDAILRNAGHYQKIRLWFEHDLYDQLQLLQLLAWFAEHPDEVTALSLICTDQYLGLTTPASLTALLAFEAPVTADQLALGSDAWAAFCADSPEPWAGLLQRDTSALPFLEGTVRRLLEEYPDPRTGLPRTAYQALCLIAQGEQGFSQLFSEYQRTESRRFMGDLGFWGLLVDMTRAALPLLTVGDRLLPSSILADQPFMLTEFGRAVVAGRDTALNRVLPDRWLGGVHLTADNSWCWDSAAQQLSRCDPS